MEVPNIVVLTRSANTFREKYPEFVGHSWLSYHVGNILDPTTLPYDLKFTHILHAAADSTLGPLLSPIERYDQIANGTRNILELALLTGVQRFLYVSSGAVYGAQPVSMGTLSEDYLGCPDPLISQNTYGVSKKIAEHLCTLYSNEHGFDCVIARCFAFIGQDLPLNVHFAAGNFIWDALFEDQINIKGDGSTIRSYLDQRDLAHWLTMLLFNGTSGKAYNVGSDRSISIEDLAVLIRDMLAPHKKIVYSKGAFVNEKSSIYVPNVTRIKEELGVTQIYTMEDSIEFVSKNIKG